jgi:hypothetical protein
VETKSGSVGKHVGIKTNKWSKGKTLLPYSLGFSDDSNTKRKMVQRQKEKGFRLPTNTRAPHVACNGRGR